MTCGLICFVMEVTVVLAFSGKRVERPSKARGVE